MKSSRTYLLLLALVLSSLSLARAQVTITEFMASNSRVLADEDGEYPDWVELFNGGSTPVNLEGWSLTDDNSNLAKWRFPAVTLGPKSFLTVFASGKDRKTDLTRLHTSFSLSIDGEYLALVQPDGVTIASQFNPDYPQQHPNISYGISQNVTTNKFIRSGNQGRILVPTDSSLGNSWTSRTFSDSAWQAGSIGVGYESSVPGFAVTYSKASSSVGSLQDAERVISTPSLRQSQTTENAPTINYFGTGEDGHYGNNRPFPGASAGIDVDDFVIEARATVTIPSAGAWTFGVNSDDGFGLTVGTFSLSWPSPRGPADSLAVFNFPAPGDYNVRLVFYERGGGSCVELFAAKGNLQAWDQATFRLVGDEANGGLAVKSSSVSGSSSAGYRSFIATDIQSQMAGRNSAAYLRIPFIIQNTAAVQSLLLLMKYDDGFIAYINGTEVARRNAPDSAQWNSAASAAHSGVNSEEINITSALPQLVAGTNILAIHGLNQSSGDSDFLISPELVEYKVEAASAHFFAQPTPGSPNGAGFLAFVADTKFSHDRGFYDAPFDLTITTETAGATIRYSTNGVAPSATNGFVYSRPIRIGGTTMIRAAAFKDGFEPSNTDTHTYLFLSDVIRQSPDGRAPAGWPASWGANTVDYGMDPAVVDNPRFSSTIKNDLKTIPTFSIVMNLRDLFDPATGIYANPGQDGRDWERPASVEMIHPDGTDGFQIDAGIRIRGGFSRSTGNPKHAFRLFFREQYGASRLEYPLFGNSGTDSFNALDLRTFQNYSWSFQGDGSGVFIRDQFSRDTQLDMGQQGERGTYIHLYINGQYWGLYNTCERPEASYGETYFGGNSDDYDVIKVEAGPYTINATDGNMAAWTRLYNLAKAGLATDEAYQRVQGRNPDGTRNPAYENLVDVPNLIDYMLVILYGGNKDAPISDFLGNTSPNNWYGLRNRNGPDGFRFIAHDSEHTLLPWELNRDRTGPFPAGDTSVSKSNPQWIWQKLQANAEFRMLAADHIHRHFFNGGALTPESARARFLERKAEIDRAVVGESARWGDAKRATPFTRDDWQNAVDSVLSYLSQRSQIVLNQLRTDGLYPNVTAPSFSQHGGAVSRGYRLNMTAPAGTIYFTTDGSDPRSPGGNLSSRAVAYSGSVPINESILVKSRVRSGTTWSALNEATFTVIQTFKELLITEIMYNPPAEGSVDGDELEFIELKNLGSSDLDLSGVHFTNGISFAFPNGTTLGAGKFVVLVSNPTEFQKKYAGVPIAGAYTGNLANGGERLTLVHAVGTVITSVSYGDALPWPSSADGTGFSLVALNPTVDSDPNNPSNWRASSKIGGSPGTEDAPANTGVVWITEVLAHTDPPQADTIELHNPNNTNVDISHWYLTDNRNVPKKFRIPAGTTIPAGGYRTFSENEFNSNPSNADNFNLSSHGEEVYLFSADAAGNLTGYSDGFAFGASANGISFGRYTSSDGQVQYPAQISSTLGAANAGPSVGPVVINEVHYFPALNSDEFIELKNVTSSPVKLYDSTNPTNTWRLSGVDFSFPTNSEIPAQGLALVVGTDPNIFRSKYSVAPSVAVYGPFTGQLQDNGELLKLQRPDAPDIGNDGASIVPYIDVDYVRFNDKAPWPIQSAGQGPSLERIQATAFANDPANWRSSPGPSSPGLENSGNRLPQVNAGIDLKLSAAAFPVTTNLVGTAADDGEPSPPGNLSVSWTQVSGPSTATFGNVNSRQTSVSFPGVGTYVLRLTASDGELAAADELTVTIELTPVQATFVPAGSTWKYLDDGSNQGTTWRAPTHSDASWRSGRAILGYGETEQATVVQFGPDSGNKYVTTYFRHAFQVQNAKSVKDLTLNLLRDDGAVVYLNGVEVVRSNMPEGAFNHQTPASGTVGGADERAYVTSIIDPSVLVEGNNVLAVEVHQVNATSTDLSFDLELKGLVSPVNQPPAVNAGSDLTVAASVPADLKGSAADDGLPVPPGAITVTWSQTSGPGTATFANAGIPVTMASFSVPGTYILRLTATDGELSAQDEMTVTVTSSDGGISAWKAQHFSASELGNASISGDNADPDNDGHNNLQEFHAGTHPRNNQDVLRVGGVQITGGTVTLNISVAAGKTYSVLYRDSLVDGAWRKLRDISAQQAAQSIDVTDSAPSNGATRYYKVVTPQQP